MQMILESIIAINLYSSTAVQQTALYPSINECSLPSVAIWKTASYTMALIAWYSSAHQAHEIETSTLHMRKEGR